MGYVGFLIGSEAMTDALFLLDTDHDDVPVNSDELNAGWRLTLPHPYAGTPSRPCD